MQRVICEVLFDKVALITAANDEVVDPEGAIDLHNVPEYGPAPNLHHRLRL